MNITDRFNTWMSDGGVLDLTPGLHTVDTTYPHADLSRDTKWILNGNGARIWFPNADTVEFENPTGGPANQDKVRLDGTSFEGAGLKFKQPNMVRVHDCIVKHAGTGLDIQNTVPEGQAEHNSFDLRIINCNLGVHAHKWSASWGSMKGTYMRTLVSGTAKPYRFARMSPYQGELHLSAFGGNVVSPDVAVFCFQGGLQGARLNLMLEGEANLALYVDESPTEYTRTPLSKQADIRMATVHRVNHVAVYNGASHNLPDWRFTHGDSHNGNDLLPQWECMDGTKVYQPNAF